MTKFLGLDSINVLKDYIDDRVLTLSGDTRIMTLQAYRFEINGSDNPTAPSSATHECYFDIDNSVFAYPYDMTVDRTDPEAKPNDWYSLDAVLDACKTEYGSVDDALKVGSIWMTIATLIGKLPRANAYTKPIKISGQNGIDGINGNNGIKMQFAYPIVEAEIETEIPVDEWDWTDYPKGISKEHPNEYVRTAVAYDDDNNVTEWSEHKLWAVYSEDGKDGRGLYAEFCFTADNARPDDKTIWYKDLPAADMSKNTPLLWARYKMDPDSSEYTAPVIYGRYGQDGTAPNYNITLYQYSNGYAKPDKPSMKDAEDKEFESLDDFLAYNSNWQLTPELLTPQLAAVEPIAITRNVSTATVTENVIEVSTFDEINAAIATATPSSGSVFIQLKNDIEIPSPIIVNEGDVHINLNNKTIKAGTFKYDEQSNDVDSYVFWVKGGKLTINGNGVVESTDATYSMAVWSNGGDVDIHAGTYINHGDGCDLIYASARKEEETKIGGTVRIYGGVFKATSYKGIEAGTGNAHSALNIKNVDRDVCTIEVYGGSFLGFDPSNNLSEPGVTDHSFLAPGVNATVDAFGNFVVIEENPIIELWWQCTALIDGKLNKVISIGDVARYTALDGTALPGEYTKFKYKWFDAQTLPEDFVFDAKDWNDTPDKDVITTPEASLWMTSCVINGVNINGELNVGEWSVPVKISGPRGPISYDYRTETRYKIGTEYAPNRSGEWTIKIPTVNSVNPYIWAQQGVYLYYMKYDDNGVVVVDDSKQPVLVGDPHGQFRMTGTNGKNGVDGKDGNSSNNVKYNSIPETTKINLYFEKNYFISNVDGEITYEFELDPISFEEGATFKFANVKGTSKFITNEKLPFILKGESITEFACTQYDCFEIVCVKDDTKQVLVVIGGKF